MTTKTMGLDEAVEVLRNLRDSSQRVGSESICPKWASSEFAREVAALDVALAALQAQGETVDDDDAGKDFFVVPEGLHPNTVNLVARFATALAEKLAAAERKYGYSDGWADAGWMDECRQKLVEHIAKGDPRDVAAYCAFLWHHGESTAGAKPDAVAGLVEEVARTIYDEWRDKPGFVGWVEGGNSDMQDQARFLARGAINRALAAQQQEPTHDRRG